MPPITNESDMESLTFLGKNATPTRKLETFPNHNKERDYKIILRTEEFTCLCPMTGQPDFAKITIEYIPDKLIVESKSLKLYFWSFRNESTFHEHVTNVIMEDLVQAMAPRWCKVTAEFAVRGGIAITVDAEYKKAIAPKSWPSPSDDAGKRIRDVAGERGKTYRSSDKSFHARRDEQRNQNQQKRGINRSVTERHHSERTQVEPRRSERKITKTPGEAVIYRKRI